MAQVVENKVRHIKKGDMVVCLSGSHKGSKGKILAVKPKTAKVQVDGIGVVKRHTKPNQANPKGGIIEKNSWLPASKFMVASDAGAKKGRVGFEGKGKDKKRIFSGERK
jgi:large subunit ribosomal protein L24